MNLTRVLNNALPELPARVFLNDSEGCHPDAVFKEHIEEGQPVVRVFVPSDQLQYRFTPQNWALIQLFDGKRSYEEIAKLYSSSLALSTAKRRFVTLQTLSRRSSSGTKPHKKKTSN